MDKKLITAHQLVTFSSLAMLGGSILVISSSLVSIAKQDAWLSALIAMVFGLIMVSIYCFLGTRFKGLTLIGIIHQLLGKWIGRVVSGLYVYFFFTMAYGIPWWVGSFGAHVMHETPVPVILLPYIVALIIGVYYGLEAFMRASEILYVFITILFVLTILLVLPHVKVDYILPVFENGPVPLLKSAFLLAAFIIFPFIAFLMIFPKHCEDLKGGSKSLLKGFLWCSTVTFITLTISILVLGPPVVEKASFPTILLAREIKIGTVFTRLEYAIAVMWTITEFVIGMLFFYVLIQSLGELLNLKDPRKIAIPLGIIVLLYAWIINPSSVEEMNWVFTAYVPNATMFGFVLPVLLLIVYLFKKAHRRRIDASDSAC